MNLPDCPITRHLATDFAEQMQRAKGPQTDPYRVWGAIDFGPTRKSPASAPSNTQSPRAER